MRTSLLRASAAVLILLIGPATAQDRSRSTPLPAHLPLGIEACYGRVYDARHLATHPRQRVTSFHIFRDFAPDPNSELELNTREHMIEVDGMYGDVSVTAYVRFRDLKGVFSNALTCRRSNNGDQVYCGVDCDGGSFKLRESGTSLILDNDGFVVLGGCGASEEDNERREYVAPGADDKSFRLDPQPVAQCVAMREARAPAWAKLGKPLRARFDNNRSTCHLRSYDAAHLRAHPQQMVRRIAVLNPKKTKKSDDADTPNYDFIFRIETRDGRSFEQSSQCSPDNYAYNCIIDNPTSDAQEFYLTRAGDGIMLRDRKGALAEAMRAKLGTDDKMFKLEPAPESACTF